MKQHDIYLEAGKKKVIAGAVEWPGWCRGGKDEGSALQTLLDYAPRYARVMKSGDVAFEVPRDLEALAVVERLEGSATTDFGVPEEAPEPDNKPFTAAKLKRSLALLDACWEALERAAKSARGKELKKGPRGGGRDLEKILAHVLESQMGYLSRIAWKKSPDEAEDDPFATMKILRQDIREALTAAQRDGLPERGPRGGKMWTASYFVRRSAWHILDHAWEIEDRILG